MATLKEAIVAILKADAQLTGAGKLGNTSLLGRSADDPFGIYFSAPAETVDLADGNYITYFVGPQSARKPRDIFINITAWGNNFEAVLERVYDLLHDATVTATDLRVLMIKFEFGGPELFDDDKKAYFRQDRFWVKGWIT